ncbi:MAG: oligoendopeptidase F [Spirochaetales bacterium]
MKTHTIQQRSQQNKTDCWDLSTLFQSDDDWEQALKKILPLAEKIVALKGHIQENDNLFEALRINEEMNELGERLGNYAFLLTAQDAGDTASQDKMGRCMMVVSEAEAKISFLIPEIQSIDETTINNCLQQENFTPYRVFLQKLLRFRPHILSEKEERLFALQHESAETPSKAFSMLTDVDMDFGTVKTEQGDMPLSQTTWSAFMLNKNREIRKDAYSRFYSVFDAHKNTLATLYAGSVNHNIYEARARDYPSAREMALFPDKVPVSVYDNLITTIRANLKPLHRYYALMKKILGVNELRHYDVYLPLTKDIRFTTSYNDATELLRKALAPLGTEYTDTLCTGLQNGWVDRYENKGKRSGAFSAGAYTGYPYILMNYKEDVLRDVFTLAHEGGHSMHSWYSSKSNPFMSYNYTIFEAEVASTFNEELLFRYLMKNTDEKNQKAYLLCVRAGDILATLYRQTMFAEYEKKTHELVESGTPLSVDVCRSIYRELLETYFGKDMILEKESDLECLRIPHFYRAFYVYKYATGISASLALAKRVLEGGDKEREEYFSFLKSGGSQYPIESLKQAGVDMEKPEAIQDAVDIFAKLVDEIENLLT